MFRMSKVSLISVKPPKLGVLIPKTTLKLRLDISTRSSGQIMVIFGQKVKGSYLRPLDPKKIFFEFLSEIMGIGLKWAKKLFLAGKITLEPL